MSNKNAHCPHCDKDLYRETLILVYQHIITMHDDMSGRSIDIKRNEYECPYCEGRIMVTGGKIVKAFK
jgi:DNA-directed RNA polymerase subunit RPC12/RpoP